MNPGFLEPLPPLPDGLEGTGTNGAGADGAGADGAGDDGATVYEIMNGSAWLVVARKAAAVSPAATGEGFRF